MKLFKIFETTMYTHHQCIIWILSLDNEMLNIIRNTTPQKLKKEDHFIISKTNNKAVKRPTDKETTET